MYTMDTCCMIRTILILKYTKSISYFKLQISYFSSRKQHVGDSFYWLVLSLVYYTDIQFDYFCFLWIVRFNWWWITFRSINDAAAYWFDCVECMAFMIIKWRHSCDAPRIQIVVSDVIHWQHFKGCVFAQRCVYVCVRWRLQMSGLNELVSNFPLNWTSLLAWVYLSYHHAMVPYIKNTCAYDNIPFMWTLYIHYSSSATLITACNALIVPCIHSFMSSLCKYVCSDLRANAKARQSGSSIWKRFHCSVCMSDWFLKIYGINYSCFLHHFHHHIFPISFSYRPMMKIVKTSWMHLERRRWWWWRDVESMVIIR